MFRTTALAAFALLSVPYAAAFNVRLAKKVYSVSSSFDLPVLEDGPILKTSEKKNRPWGVVVDDDDDDDGIDDIDNMSMKELKEIMLDLQGGEDWALPERATLEEARNIVWDHVVHSSLSSTPCCPDFPFCGCPKM